jgi:parvulin-like peptidyl-prolyl isomerase
MEGADAESYGMTSEPFLTIDDQPITISQVFRYLQAGGKLDGFIGEIVRQYVIERSLTEEPNLQPSPAVLEQAVVDFRLSNKLTDAQVFQQWLSTNGLTYEAFHERIAIGFRMDKLRQNVTEPKLQEYFIERKMFLDRVVLSRIIVDSKDLAEELRLQLSEGASFEQLAREHSLLEDRVMNGMMGPVSRGSMPDILRAAIDLAEPGQIVGPIELEGRWALFRVEELLPAVLENPQVRQTLQNELFDQWLAEKIQTLPIKINIGE